MKRTPFLLVVALLIACVGIAAADPSDWAYYSGGYGKNITYKFVGSETMDYDVDIQSAADSWNDTATPVSAAYSSTSSNTYEVSITSFIGYTWYGMYTPTTNIFGTVTRFDIDVNMHSLWLDGISGAGQTGTMAHEMGHAFALNDLDYGDQLMSHTRDRDVIYVPQDGDIAGVNAIW